MPALQLLRAIYNLKDEIVRRGHTIETNKDNSVTVSFGDLKCTVCHDNIKIRLDKSETSFDDYDDCEYNKNDLWEATFTENNISIRRYTGKVSDTRTNTRDATLNITDDKIEGQILTNTTFDTLVNKCADEQLMDGFIDAVKPAMPFLQELIQDKNNELHLLGLFKATPIYQPLDEIIKGYVI
jgi:hypothetical protein